MKVTVNTQEPKRKVVAFVDVTGQLVFRNRDNDLNTVLKRDGTCAGGFYKFDHYVEMNANHKLIYEGDSITIQF